MTHNNASRSRAGNILSAKTLAFLQGQREDIDALLKSSDQSKDGINALKKLAIDGVSSLKPAQLDAILKLANTDAPSGTALSRVIHKLREDLEADITLLQPPIPLNVAITEFWKSHGAKVYECLSITPRTISARSALDHIVKNLDYLNVGGGDFEDHEIVNYTVAPARLEGYLAEPNMVEFLRGIATRFEAAAIELRTASLQSKKPSESKTYKRLSHTLLEIAYDYSNDVMPSLLQCCGYEEKRGMSK